MGEEAGVAEGGLGGAAVRLQPPHPRIGGTFSALEVTVNLEIFGSLILKKNEIFGLHLL